MKLEILAGSGGAAGRSSTMPGDVAPNDIFIPRLLIEPRGWKQAGQPSRNVGPMRRAAILATVRHMICELGCDQVKMRTLAHRSEVTPPTIYSLVGGRHEVLRDALHEGLCAKFSLAKRRAEIENINPVLAFISCKIDAIENYPSYYKNVARGARLSQLDASTVLGIDRAITQWIHRQLKIMERAGQIKSPQHISLDAAAAVVARQLSNAVMNWSSGSVSWPTVRSELIAGASLAMLALVTQAEQARIEAWLDRHA